METFRELAIAAANAVLLAVLLYLRKRRNGVNSRGRRTLDRPETITKLNWELVPYEFKVDWYQKYPQNAPPLAVEEDEISRWILQKWKLGHVQLPGRVPNNNER